MNNASIKPSDWKESSTLDDRMRTLRERLEFIEMSPEACATIKSLKSIVDRELPVALDRLYVQLRKTPETKAFFRSEEHMRSAKGAQTGHWVNISNGDFTENYLKNVQAIGAVHARIGIEPRWYIGGYAIVLDHLIKAAIDENFPQGGWFAGKPKTTPAEFGKALGSLAKAVMLDMDLAISVYLEEAEKAKQAAQADAVAGEQKIVSESFGRVIRSIAAKDLSSRVSGEIPDAYHALRDDLNESMTTLQAALQTIGDNVESIDAVAEEISIAAEDLSERTEQQAALVEKTASALAQITATVNDTANRTEEAGRLATHSREGAEKSEAVVLKAISTMGEIEQSSRKIASITEMVDEIAFQTNLLALNAGVEAARAGAAGKGFAVVAQEVRDLAQRSAMAAKEINDLITRSEEQVKSGVALVAETGNALHAIVGDVREISRHVIAISDAARDQAVRLQQVNVAVSSIDRGTQQNAAMVEESSAASRNLAQEAERLKQLLSGFRLEAATDGELGCAPVRQSSSAEPRGSSRAA